MVKRNPIGFYFGAALILAVLSLVGCQLPSVVQEPVAPPAPQHSIGVGLVDAPAMMKSAQSPNTPGFFKFPHNIHVTDQGMACTDCHEISDGKPGMPDHDTCSTCHDINIDEPDESCTFCHILTPQQIQEKAFVDVSVEKPKKVDEFKFDHSNVGSDAAVCLNCHKKAADSKVVTDNVGGNHATLFAEVRKTGGNTSNCAICHTNISAQNPPDWHKRPDFQQTHGREKQRIQEGMCLNCHTENQCQSCHRQTKPQTHERPEWARSHGKVGTFDQQACLMCHSDQSCRTCHNSEMPRDHTNFFRTRSHGNIASWNRDRCLVCHKQDYCESCHVGAAPPVTAQAFHAPGADCLSCHSPASPVRPLRRHGPLPQESCMKCHRFQ